VLYGCHDTSDFQNLIIAVKSIKEYNISAILIENLEEKKQHLAN